MMFDIENIKKEIDYKKGECCVNCKHSNSWIEEEIGSIRKYHYFACTRTGLGQAVSMFGVCKLYEYIY